MWPLEYTNEFEEWFVAQKEDHKMAINAKAILLAEFGPNLGRPYVDTLQGSKYANLKELRVKFKNAVIRILFCFNKSRDCWILIGGDKKGKNEKRFYREIINKAEEIIDKYPEILGGRDA